MFALQGTLLGGDEMGVDPGFRATERIWLDAATWIDIERGWLRGADEAFATLAETLPWRQKTVTMWDKRVLEPRLTAWCPVPHPMAEAPWDQAIIHEARLALEVRYGVPMPWVGANWYRDGRDSVAWHRDRTHKTQPEPMVAIVSLGAPRAFLVRPFGGGRSRRWDLSAGDLFVMGGRAQQDWEHHVPKVASAGPRISLMFRDHTA